MKLFQKSTSYLSKGHWTNDKSKRKYRHMAVFPFPVCEFAAIHYKDGRRLENTSNYTERRRPRMRKNKTKWNKIK